MVPRFGGARVLLKSQDGEDSDGFKGDGFQGGTLGEGPVKSGKLGNKVFSRFPVYTHSIGNQP